MGFIKIRQNLRKKMTEVKISSCLNVLVYLRIAQRLICSNQVEMRPFHDAALHQGRCTEDNEETQFLTSPTIHYKRVLQNNSKYSQILIIVFIYRLNIFTHFIKCNVRLLFDGHISKEADSFTSMQIVYTF